MKHLHDVLSQRGEEFFRALLNDHIAINVKIDQIAFVVQRAGNELVFKNREGKGEISKVKRAGMDLYEDAIQHIHRQSWQQLPDKYEIYLELFTDQMQTVIQYKQRPKNNLIVSYIKDDKGTVLRPDLPINKRVAHILNISPPPLLFSGKLSNQQKQQIIDYVKRPDPQQSFLDFIMSIFMHGPELKWLHETGYEGVVFYFGDTDLSAKLVDPLFTATIVNKKAETAEADWTRQFKETVFELVFTNMSHVVAPFELTPEFSKDRDSESLYIDFIAYLTKSLLDWHGEYLQTKFAPYEEYAKNKRFSGVTWSLLPSYMKQLNDKYWFTPELFSTILFLLQKPKRVDLKAGITPERKLTINGIVDSLKKKGIVP